MKFQTCSGVTILKLIFFKITELTPELKKIGAPIGMPQNNDWYLPGWFTQDPFKKWIKVIPKPGHGELYSYLGLPHWTHDLPCNNNGRNREFQDVVEESPGPPETKKKKKLLSQELQTQTETIQFVDPYPSSGELTNTQNPMEPLVNLFQGSPELLADLFH